MAAPDRRRPKGQDDLVDWFTVSYRSIYIAVGLVALLAGGVGYYYYTRNVPAPTLPIAPPSTVTTARFTTIFPGCYSGRWPHGIGMVGGLR